MLLLVMLVAMSNHSMNSIVRLISAMVMFRMIMILEVILALSNNYFKLDKKTASIVKNMIFISANNYDGNTDGIRVKGT